MGQTKLPIPWFSFVESFSSVNRRSIQIQNNVSCSHFDFSLLTSHLDFLWDNCFIKMLLFKQNVIESLQNCMFGGQSGHNSHHHPAFYLICASDGGLILKLWHKVVAN